MLGVRLAGAEREKPLVEMLHAGSDFLDRLKR